MEYVGIANPNSSQRKTRNLHNCTMRNLCVGFQLMILCRVKPLHGFKLCRSFSVNCLISRINRSIARCCGFIVDAVAVYSEVDTVMVEVLFFALNLFSPA